jgi:phosphate butyryltransferase
MKGHLETAEMIRAVVKKETGIAIKETISHINLMEIEKYDKLVIMTDVAISINPTLEQKKDILENAVSVFHALGYEKPKVAAVCAIEKINPKMPETVEAKELKDLNEAGIIKNCIVEGPISFDIAMDKGRATRKHFEGKIQGDADILLMPNLLAGNLLSKGISIFGEAKAVGFVMGAEVPIVLTSRGALAKAKYQSMLACLAIV